MSFISNVAKGRNGLFHYVFTIILVISSFFIGQFPLLAVIEIKRLRDSGITSDELNAFRSNPDFSLLDMDRNLGFFLLLLSFVVAFFVLLLCIRYIHRRSFLSLFSYDEKIDWRRILWSAGLWFLIILIGEAVMFLLQADNYTFNKPGLTSFAILLLIVILVLPFQTAFEELFIRSYIFQAIGYNTGSVVLALFVSTLTFGLLHGFNPEVSKYGFWPMMSYYLIAGIIMGLIVIFDRRIELAIGVHTATNAFGALFVTYKGAAIQTDSLFMISEINPIYYTLLFIIAGVLFIAIAGRKYKWNFEISKHRKIDE